MLVRNSMFPVRQIDRYNNDQVRLRYSVYILVLGAVRLPAAIFRESCRFSDSETTLQVMLTIDKRDHQLKNLSKCPGLGATEQTAPLVFNGINKI